MALTQDEITKRLLQARKLGETPDWATIGKDPDNAGNPFQAQIDTGETNVVYATVRGNPDPQIIYYDPSCDLRLLQYGARVELEWRNGKAWVKGADKEFLTQQQAGTPLPTGNFPLRAHDHTSTAEGGALGADTVDTTQIVDSAVTTAKINNLAVTTAKIAALAVTSAELASNAVTTAKINDNAITEPKVSGLTSSTNAYVRQASSGAFESEKYNLTTSAPSATDDINSGYRVGSKWYDTNADKYYVCINSDASAAIWQQITGDDSVSIDNINSTIASNSRLFYDGTIIRKAYAGQEVSNTTGLTTSGTTEADVIEITIANTDINNASTLEIGYEYRCYGTVVGDVFLFRLYYYNGSGYTAVAMSKAFQTLVSGNIAVFNYTWLVDQSALGTAPDVNGSSDYLWKITVQRNSGTGNLFIYRGPDITLLRVKEV